MCETTSHFQPPALELPQKVLQEVRMASEIAAKAPKSTRESFQEQARLASGTVFECPTEKSTSGDADLAPKTAPEDHLGPPGGRNLTPGGRNLTPGVSFLGPPGVDFSTPCERLSHAGGAILCLLCSRHLARRNARGD